MKNFRLILLVTALIFVNACTNTNTKDNTRGLASEDLEILRVSELDVPVDIILNTEYRGSFVADLSTVKVLSGLPGLLINKDCRGSISIWFYKDSEGKLRYYSTGVKAEGADCKLPKLGDMADVSQQGMDACAGLDFNYKVIDLNNIAYLREINFANRSIVAPVCDTPRPDRDVQLEYKDTLKLGKFKANGKNGNLHLQITLFKILKMNYYITPMINIR